MNTKQDAPITDADREAALAALDPSGLEDLWGEDVTRVAQAIANARAAGAKAAQQSPVPGLVSPTSCGGSSARGRGCATPRPPLAGRPARASLS